MFRKVLVPLVLLILAMPAAAQTATPFPQAQDLNEKMATAAAQSNQLPTDINKPQGADIVPSGDASPLWGYVKWLFSLNTAQELLGQRMAPLGINLFIVLMIGMLLTGVYLVVNLITFIIRFAYWMWGQLVKLLELLQ